MSRPAMRVALCVFAGVAIIASSAAATATASFPDDATPINIVDAKYTSQYPVFLGPRPKNETRRHKLSFQMMVITNSTLFIAARDHVYHVDLDNAHGEEIPSEKTLTWKSRATDKDICTMKGKQKDECHNFIKVLLPRNDGTIFVCGTNAFNPMCRVYRLHGERQDAADVAGVARMEGDEINGMAKCPYDSKHSNVALFSGGKLYSATVTDFLASDAVIYRSLGSSPALRTIKYDSKWLKEPQFVNAVEYGNYIYYFFREMAVEYSSMGKVVFSRVARVCKNDVGGSQRVLERHWTSFLKARLNCSVPGEPRFYFNVLRAVTGVVTARGRALAVGVFTTPQNSIPGSAVCAFDMVDVEGVFDGRFKEQRQPDGGWTTVPEDKVPRPRPGCCAGTGSARDVRSSVELPDETLAFIKTHPLVEDSVPALLHRPGFTKTMVRYRLTKIEVDTEAGPHGNHTVIFLGSEDGVLLKVLSQEGGAWAGGGGGGGPTGGGAPVEGAAPSGLLLEEIHAYNPHRCNVDGVEDRRIVGLQLDRAHHALFVAFPSCIVKVALSRCERHARCKRTCIASRDPYCGWAREGSCARITAPTSVPYEQDIEHGNSKGLEYCQAEGFVAINDSAQQQPPPTPRAGGSGGAGGAAPATAAPPRITAGHVPAVSAERQHPPGAKEGFVSGNHLGSLFSDKSVDVTILALCVVVAFVLGAALSGVTVYCLCGEGGAVCASSSSSSSPSSSSSSPHFLSLRCKKAAAAKKLRAAGGGGDGGGGGGGDLGSSYGMETHATLARLNSYSPGLEPCGKHDGGGGGGGIVPLAGPPTPPLSHATAIAMATEMMLMMPNGGLGSAGGVGGLGGAEQIQTELAAGLPTPDATPVLPLKNCCNQARRDCWEQERNLKNAAGKNAAAAALLGQHQQQQHHNSGHHHPHHAHHAHHDHHGGHHGHHHNNHGHHHHHQHNDQQQLQLQLQQQQQRHPQQPSIAEMAYVQGLPMSPASGVPHILSEQGPHHLSSYSHTNSSGHQREPRGHGGGGGAMDKLDEVLAFFEEQSLLLKVGASGRDARLPTSCSSSSSTSSSTSSSSAAVTSAPARNSLPAPPGVKAPLEPQPPPSAAAASADKKKPRAGVHHGAGSLQRGLAAPSACRNPKAQAAQAAQAAQPPPSDLARGRESPDDDAAPPTPPARVDSVQPGTAPSPASSSAPSAHAGFALPQARCFGATATAPQPQHSLLARQSSFSGGGGCGGALPPVGLMPRTNAGVKRSHSVKPDVPPKPGAAAKAAPCV
ncbi:semaphorin-6A-like isoform X1 [Lethenteron reissneri]|uniref:semaphorin-6A-like isoform X1 n=1 Tax=Lethenteron reissneri TaxID=7753 RepID=UPI002AB74AF5|nr:semaphorin-6A-like isoform X1 [Lethenteron reissneri]XP_061408704.1 semaphorin-6A-like isoform X1 [Lethenteron reissneri]